MVHAGGGGAGGSNGEGGGYGAGCWRNNGVGVRGKWRKGLEGYIRRGAGVGE